MTSASGAAWPDLWPAAFELHKWVPPVVSPTRATCLEAAVVGAVIAFVCVAGRGRWSFAAPLAFAPVILVFSFERGAVSRLLKSRIGLRLGAWSYSVNMVHAFVAFVIGFGLNALERALGRTMWRQTEQAGHLVSLFAPGHLGWGDAILALYLVTVLVLSRLTYRFVEVPSRAWFNRRATVSKM